MIGLVGERAHVRNAYVKQMPGISCGVGKTAANLLGRLDHNNFDPFSENIREMQRSKCSGGAAADDCNSHHVRPSP
jgi:hypothetical protein